MLWRQFRYYSNTADLSSRSSHRWSTIGPFPRTSEPRIGSTLWLHDMWHVTCTCVGVIVSDILCGVDVIAHNPLNCCTWSVHMSTCQMYSNVAYELHYIVIRGMSSYVRAAGPYSWNDHAMQPSFLVHWHTGQDSGILRTQCLPSGRWTNVCCQKYVKNSKDISLVSQMFCQHVCPAQNQLKPCPPATRWNFSKRSESGWVVSAGVHWTAGLDIFQNGQYELITGTMQRDYCSLQKLIEFLNINI